MFRPFQNESHSASGDRSQRDRCAQDHAADASEHEYFEWVCFGAQLGAEKAAKAIYLHLHGEGWGRSCTGHRVGDRWNPIFGCPAPRLQFNDSSSNVSRPMMTSCMKTRRPLGVSWAA